MDALQIGSGYVAETLVGQGACGQVWAGHDTEGRPWAIKVLRSELAQDPGLVNRFVAERSLLEAIRHPNVVTVHDLVVEGTTLAVIMPLIDGQDLRAVLKQRGPVEPAGVAAWGAQIAGALQAAHRAGVVHRDVKPENVLVTETDQAMLSDFGIARIVDGATHSTMMLGTPHYMAPEIAEGRTPGPAADLYSLGIMLYELCCGVPPFSGRGSAMATLRAHLEEVPGRPGGVSDELWDVISTLMNKEPDRRGGTAGQVEARLAALVPRLEGLAPAPRLAEPPAAEHHLTYAPVVDAAVAEQTSQWVAPATPMTPGHPMLQGYGSVPPGYASPPGYGPPPAYMTTPPGYVAAYPAAMQPYPVAAQAYPGPEKRKGASPILLGVGAAALIAAGVAAAMMFGGDDDAAETTAVAPSATASVATSAAVVPSPAAATPPPAAAPQPAAAAQPRAAAGTRPAVAPAPAPAASAKTYERAQTFSAPAAAPAPQRPGADEAARKEYAESLLAEYLAQAESGMLSSEGIESYFAPTVSWYGKSKSRDAIPRISRGDASKPRTQFSTNYTDSFAPATSYGGTEADVIRLHRSFQRPNGASGNVLVTYTLVYDRSGQGPRIAAVSEKRL